MASQPHNNLAHAKVTKVWATLGNSHYSGVKLPTSGLHRNEALQTPQCSLAQMDQKA